MERNRRWKTEDERDRTTKERRRREAREAERETRDEEDHRAVWSFGFRGVFTRAVVDR